MFCGIDWAETHHDVALVDAEGRLLARCRIADDLAGLETLIEHLAKYGDGAERPIPVAIETVRGLLVACLRATTHQIYPINPMAVSRYRDRHSPARKKSDHGDALVLAHILRTDRAAHRPIPADTELAHRPIPADTELAHRPIPADTDLYSEAAAFHQPQTLAA